MNSIFISLRYKYKQNISTTVDVQKNESLIINKLDLDIKIPEEKVKQYQPHKEKLNHISIPPIKKSIHKKIQSNQKYSCDGRIWCSQMHSCEEATFFINNCPGTKMDGNHDGVPCERQWCRH